MQEEEEEEELEFLNFLTFSFIIIQSLIKIYCLLPFRSIRDTSSLGKSQTE